jgi:hypothetical protein
MSLLPPHETAPLVPRSTGLLRWALSRVRAYSGIQAPPAAPGEQALYGFSQPILGARVLLRDPELLKEALLPAGVLGLACALWATLHADAGQYRWFKEFYTAFAALAPLPSLLFANHYARLAALIRWRLGLGACGPREMPFGMLVGRLLRQSAIVAIGILPVVWVADMLPGIGDLLKNAALAVWGLHWVVADAFDDAQVCEPGESLKESIDRDRNAPPPWFVRWLNRGAAKLPGFLGRPVRWFARLCDKLALDSRGEIAVMEANRAVSVGFALSTAALLATPVLNLLFRPIILAGSSHLLGQLEKDGHGHSTSNALSGAGTPTSALEK